MADFQDYERYQEQAKSGQAQDYASQIPAFLLGGPVGWYEALTGKKLLSQNILKETGPIAYREMSNEDVFKSMTPQDWGEFAKMNAGERQDFVTGRLKKITPDLERQKQADQAALLQKQQDAEYKTWRMDVMRRLDAFSKEMGMPVEELIAKGNLGVINAGNTGRTQASSAARAAGLGGGISNLNTQRAITDAQAKYQMARQGLGLQATQALMQGQGQMAHDQEGIRQYEQNMNMQLQQAREAANQRAFAEGSQRQGQTFGTITGIAGTIYGGPQVGAAAYQLGSGAGQQAYGQYQPTQMTYPRGTSTPGSGGLSGNYRGAQ